MVDAAIKILIRGMVALVVEEESAAKERFYELHGTMPLWPLELQALRDIISTQFTDFGVPTDKTLIQAAGEIDREDVKLVVQELTTIDVPSKAEFSQQVRSATLGLLTADWKRVLGDTTQILTTGKQVDKQKQQGLVDSVRHTMNGAIEILGNLTPEQRVSTLRQDIDIFRQEYLDRRDNPQRAFGMTWGIPQLDQVTKGIFPGELAVIAGFAGEGKTTMLMNMLHHQLVICGFNIYLWSGEMRKEQIWRMLACIHSRRLDWGEKGFELDYDKLKSAQLTPEEEDFFLNTLLTDLKSNKRYGNLYIEPSDRENPTLKTLWTRAEVINSMDPLDMVYFDYNRLIKPARGERSGDFRADLNQIILNMKEMAKSFDRGRMIGVATAHQTNRQGKQRADEAKNGVEGVYDMMALADANEVEKSADHVIATWQNESARQRREARITHLKNRDGRAVPPFDIYADAEGRFVGPLQTDDDEGDLSLLNV